MATAVFLAAATALGWVNGRPGFPNTLEKTPLRGWRSWSAYAFDINQGLMERAMEGLAARRAVAGGQSLADAGYRDVGLDAGYEMPGHGVDGGCHDASGHMLINATRFPSFVQMNAKAHSLNLTSSWYLNSDACRGTNETRITYSTDADDAVKYGFDGVKFDTERGGVNHNITDWATALNATGKPMLIENCLDKHPTFLLTDPGNCPFNHYRAGPDNGPSFYGGIASVYVYTLPFLNTSVGGVQASRPGCFAYADLLGVGSPVRGTEAWSIARSNGCADMTLDEERTLFANWVVVSSPVVLGFDVGDDAVIEKYWPIVANERAIAVHDAWAGEAGRLLWESSATFVARAPIGATCKVERPQTLPLQLTYSKQLPGGGCAVLVINLGNTSLAGETLSLDDMREAASPRGGPKSAAARFVVTEVWSGMTVHTVSGGAPWVLPAIAPHSSVFVTAAPS